MRRSTSIALTAVLALSAVGAAPPPRDGTTPLRCQGQTDRAHPLQVDVDVDGDGEGDERAAGLYAVPRHRPDTLVVYGHGYGHSSESWR